MASDLLISAFYEHFVAGGSFSTIVEARQQAETHLGEKIYPGTTQAKKVEEFLEASLVRVARSVVERAATPKEAYAQLVDLYHRQPTLGTRSSTSILQQAYSTPLPIAYLAAIRAGITPQTTVYEPTAGHGALLLLGNPTNVTVNELNEARASDLRNQGYIVTQNDAAIHLPQKQHDVVIANPPFGTISDQGVIRQFDTGYYRTTQIDHAIAFRALQAMKPDGRAVLILGGKLGEDLEKRSDRYNSRQTRAFYYSLYQHYNVADHISIHGELYRKQGAGFPIDLIAIEGFGQSKRPLPAVQVPLIFYSFEQLGDYFNEYLYQRSKGLESTSEPEVTGYPSTEERKPTERGTVFGTVSPQGFMVDRPMDGGATGNTTGNPTATRNGIEPTRSDAGSSDHTPGEGRNSTDANAMETTVERSTNNPQRDTQAGTVGAGVNFSSKRVPTARGRNLAVGIVPRVQRGDTTEPGGMVGRDELSIEGGAVMSESDRQKQAAYMPKSEGQSLDTLVPVNLQTALNNALTRLEGQVGSFDEYVADRLGYGTPEQLHKYLSAEQVDACALAIANLEKKSGCIIADQTGLGKGRTCASLILYAKLTGRVAIFVTKDAPLYVDMIRDLSDINMSGFKPFVTNASLNLPLPDGRILKTAAPYHQKEMEDLMRSGNLGNYDAIFTTYSQLQTVKGRETLRHEFLRTFVPNAILLLDESHEAGGSVARDRQGRVINTSVRAQFVRELVELADGVTYLSATYAKRPEVMDLYAQTDMRLAVRNVSSLTWMVQQGGIPLQQALATMLTESGQYIRRERSFEGIKFEAAIVPVNREVAENMAQIMAGVLAFDRIKRQALGEVNKELKAEAKAVLGDNAIGDAGASSTNFTSIMHNLISQMLLALKAEAVVEKCLQLMRQSEPEKPVVALAHTMGSFIGQFAQLNDLKPGDSLNLSFGDLLRRYLERSREIITSNAFGVQSRQRLSDAQLGPEGVAQYEAVLDLIAETDLSEIPISPIDYVRFRLEREGYRINEITGREHIVEYGSTGEIYYQRRSSAERSKAAAVENVKAFNNGQLDILILNRSGSTGISLHASEKFHDQRRRHEIIWEAENDINPFVQMLGRVHRTGQVVTPQYTLLMADIPAEKRPGAVLAQKMASLNANVTAARKSGFSFENVPDFMNEYGDQVVAEIMTSDPDLHAKIDFPLSGGEEELSVDNAIRKVTGRIPLLSLAEQEKLYNRIEADYKELVERQEAMGESILEAQTLDLEARTLSRMEVSPPDTSYQSPFTDAVYLEGVDAKTTHKPLTTLQIIEQVRLSLALPEIEKGRDAIESQASIWINDIKTQIESQLIDYRQKQISRLKNPDAIAKLNDRLNKQHERLNDVLNAFAPGQTVRLLAPSTNVFYGVVGKVWQVNQDNPITLSGWRLQVLLADPAREIVIPLSRLNTGKENAFDISRAEQDWFGNDIYQSFDLKQQQEREQRQIFTGNLLRAYEQFPKGKIVNFTDSFGQMRQGIITPKDFDIEKALHQQPVIMSSVTEAYQFLTEVRSQLKTLDELLLIKPQRQGDGFVLQTAKAREMAGHYYLDATLLETTGAEFYSVGERMECQVELGKLQSVLSVIVEQKRWYLAAFEEQHKAREMLGLALPKLEPFTRQPMTIEPTKPLVKLRSAPSAEENIGKFIEQAGLSKQIYQAEEFYLKIANEPYLPLVVEQHGGRLYLTHYLTQNGDTYIDAEMVFQIVSGQLQLQETAVNSMGGEHRACDRVFAQTFSSNLLDQGFAQAARSLILARQHEESPSHETITVPHETWQPSLFSLEPYLVSDKSAGVFNSSAWDVLVDGENLEYLSATFPVQGVEVQVEVSAQNSQLQVHDTLVVPSVQLLDSISEALDYQKEQPISNDFSQERGNSSNHQPEVPSPSIDNPIPNERQEVSDVNENTNLMESLPSNPTLSDLRDWYQKAQALGKTQAYLERVVTIAGELVMTETFSKRARIAMEKVDVEYDAALTSLREWYRAAKVLGRSEAYLERIVAVAQDFKSGTCLTEKATTAKEGDLNEYRQDLEKQQKKNLEMGD